MLPIVTFINSYGIYSAWFVDEEVCTVVLKDCGKLIEENEVEVRPEKLPDR